MTKFLHRRLVIIGLTVLSAAISGFLVLNWMERTRVYRVTIAAGASTGESFVLGQALKTVIQRHHPNIQLTVLETGGTAESLALLEQGRVGLAAAQADVPVGSSARLIAVLYEDTFQLLVRKGSRVKTFADLRGKRVALATSGGQYQSFLRVAEHFGMTSADCTFVGATDEDADRMFVANQADAVFRVRALGNPAIWKLVQAGNAEFVPIDQARAMQIQLAAFRPSVIPQGAYLGAPPIPPSDLPSVGVQRTLLTRADTSEDVVQAITAQLMEGRQELSFAIPDDRAEVRALLAGVKPPDMPVGLGPPVHAGAQQYYDKDKPAFVEEYADFVALILTIVLLVGSWGWELRHWVRGGQKNRADEYSHEVVLLITRTQAARDRMALEGIRTELFALLTKVVRALDVDEITDESFQSFRVVWQIALDLLRERQVPSAGFSSLTESADVARVAVVNP